MYDVGGKLLNNINFKGMYVNSLACVRVKRGESDCFSIDSVVRQGVYHVPLDFQCIYGCSNERGENGDEEEGNEMSGEGKRVEIVWYNVCR